MTVTLPISWARALRALAKGGRRAVPRSLVRHGYVVRSGMWPELTDAGRRLLAKLPPEAPPVPTRWLCDTCGHDARSVTCPTCSACDTPMTHRHRYSLFRRGGGFRIAGRFGRDGARIEAWRDGRWESATVVTPIYGPPAIRFDAEPRDDPRYSLPKRWLPPVRWPRSG